jgi:hypothetical protein
LLIARIDSEGFHLLWDLWAHLGNIVYVQVKWGDSGAVNGIGLGRPPPQPESHAPGIFR